MMAPQTTPIHSDDHLPHSTGVVIIGGGIVGMTAALVLAERKIPVTVVEKGRIGAEQSSRNLGWVRKTNRAPEDVPLALAADPLWQTLEQRCGQSVGYRQAGIMFVATSEQEQQGYEQWLDQVDRDALTSRLLSSNEVAKLAPGSRVQWRAGLYTPSDGYAEPTLATSAIANKAQALGAVLLEHCAARGLSRSAGKISGVITEHGEIRCDGVLIAGGMWSRRLLGIEGVNLPTLPLICSACHTTDVAAPTEAAVGASNFSFRRHQRGGYIVTQRSKLNAPLTFDHLLLGRRYLSTLKAQHRLLRISVGRYGWDDARRGRRWHSDMLSPFEKLRVMSPLPNQAFNNNALKHLAQAWPCFEGARIKDAWAGVMDITPDSNPVISTLDDLPGVTVATGFSGHGFGTAPAAGQLAADLVMGTPPLVDPTPYRFSRFN
ncbi:NAD(P)/FAD-dependent oxidoreductase [Carnimonas bestiolae]|uniref:NAD(P)/FAD-dependent oxidoreductase n=1 Tax=Carnimonas bestiolae TaxID=3402172 RepID=UPI003EDC53D9